VKSHATPDFWKAYGSLPEEIKKRSKKVYNMFSKAPSHPRLQMERLVCDKRCWSIRITKDYRAVGILKDDTMIWLWI